MRLSWLALAFALIAVTLAVVDLSSTDSTSTLPADTTTPVPEVDDGTTTTGPPGNTDAPVTDGPTDKPVTDGPEPTDDGNTAETKPTEKTTVKVVTTTVKTTVKAGSTTTKEPEPDVERFSVHCDKETQICTYTMQVPGLDVDTFDSLIKQTNQTEEDVNNFEGKDLVNLQEGVTKVYDDAQATVGYVQSQLDEITIEIKNLETQADALNAAIDDLNLAVTNAQKSLNTIFGKKGSCLYRQCVLKETTTKKPTTTTTVRTTPTPYCSKPGSDKICQNKGTCVNWYDSYYCTCKGNLDGQENDCNTSVCDKIKDVQAPGPIYSPGYNGTNYAEDDCDGASWTVAAVESGKILSLEEKEFKKGEGNIENLTANSNLQLTVDKYKLKITSKTKLAQITQILAYGGKATITYSGPKEDFFHFTITEIDP